MYETEPNKKALAPSATFIPGTAHQGQIGHYLDCSADPYDLRPAVDITLGAAYAMREAMPEDQPLVIIVGESHHMPSRFMLMQLLAARLLDRQECFTMNFEWDHNYWGVLARNDMQRDIPPALYYNPYGYDPDGQAVLSALLAAGEFGSAPVAKHSLEAFCYAHNVPTILNCPALDGDYALDLRDSFTASMVRQHLGRDDIKGLKLTRDNPEDMRKCMAISNLAMATRGVEQAEAHGAGIVLQFVGLNHVFGVEQHGCRYEVSLVAAYRNAGAAVLPVFPTMKDQRSGINIIPEAGYESLSSAVVIDGLAEDGFGYGETEAEKICIEKLRQHSGEEVGFWDVASDKEHYKACARRDADEVMRRYEAAHPSLEA